jgi:ABC-type multidrug transport system ATPase subunit
MSKLPFEMEKIIEVRGLYKSFNDHVAVNGLDLDVYRGDIFGFLGPNGAGKSTTIRMLLSLIRPDKGSIRLFGRNLVTDREFILRKVGCIIEKPDFYKYLSARKNIQVLASYSGLHVTEKKVDELLEFVGLHGRGGDRVDTYSHGMRQRLGLAQALVHDPELIILDEPTTGLDPQGIIDIRKLIEYLSKEKGKTVFLSSHILHELELVATRMAILNRGNLVIQGEKSALLNDSMHFVELEVDRVEDACSMLIESHPSWNPRLSEGVVQVELAKESIPLLVELLSEKQFRIYNLASRRQLEHLFLRLTESAERMQVGAEK